MVIFIKATLIRVKNFKGPLVYIRPPYQVIVNGPLMNFCKAFVSIDITMMCAILCHYGILHEIVETVRVLYDKSRSAKLVDNLQTDPFKVSTGVLQRDVSSPFLFIIVIDVIMQNASTSHGFVTLPVKFLRQPTRIINDLNFADDIALLQSLLNRAQNS